MTDLLQHVANGVVQGLFIGMAALAITLVFGIARFPNAATGDMMTFGAYAGLVAQQATNSLVLAGAVAILAGAAVALASHWLVFRRLAGRSVVSLLVASIGVAFMIRAVLGVVFGQAQAVFQVPLTRADEPFAGVNPVLIGEIVARIRELNAAGIGFLIIEHDLEALTRLVPYLAVLDRGRIIAQGGPDAVLADAAVREAYLGGVA